jgi:hypothetical protein
MSIQRVKFFSILLLSLSISTIAMAATGPAPLFQNPLFWYGNSPSPKPDAPSVFTLLPNELLSAISDNPSPENVKALVTANHPVLAVDITLAAISKAPGSAAEITAAAITAAPDHAAFITAAAITAPSVKGKPNLQAAITYAAIKANPSLRDAIIAAAVTAVGAAPDAIKAISAAAVAATAEADSSTIAVSSSSESVINNQELQAQNFAVALTECNGKQGCITATTAKMTASSSLSPAEIKAVENSVSPNSP